MYSIQKCFKLYSVILNTIKFKLPNPIFIQNIVTHYLNLCTTLSVAVPGKATRGYKRPKHLNSIIHSFLVYAVIWNQLSAGGFFFETFILSLESTNFNSISCRTPRCCNDRGFYRHYIRIKSEHFFSSELFLVRFVDILIIHPNFSDARPLRGKKRKFDHLFLISFYCLLILCTEVRED